MAIGLVYSKVKGSKLDFEICFLVACTRLYKPLSVGRSVGRSVGPSVRRCSRSTRLMAIGLVETACACFKFIYLYIKHIEIIHGMYLVLFTTDK